MSSGPDAIASQGRTPLGRLAAAAAPAAVYAWSLVWILSRRFEGYPPGNDSAYYLVSGLGFGSGAPYKDFSIPDPGAGALLGPSLLPMLLGLYWKFLHPNLPALKLIVAMVSALAPVAILFWFRLWLSPFLALVSALAFGSGYLFVVQGNSVMTESLFCPLIYFALWLSHRGLQPHEGGGKGGGKGDGQGDGKGGGKGGVPWAAWASVALWVMAARTRVVGWCFLAAFLLLAGWRRRLSLLAAGIVMAGTWVGMERWLASPYRTMRYTDGLFTDNFPVLVDPWHGLLSLADNLRANLWAFVSSVEAHVLFPLLYDAVPMSPAKRLACLAVFAWTAWGGWLVWRRHASLRPWMAASALACVPTFVIFAPHDLFRYLLPFLPFLILAFLAPFRLLGERASGPVSRPWLPASAAVAILAAQSLHSARHPFEIEYIPYAEDFVALHDSLASAGRRPDMCLSNDSYFTFLKTGCLAFNLSGRHRLEYVRKHAQGKEAWAFCGPANAHHCERWEAAGVRFGEPVAQAGYWRLLRIEAWPDSSGSP